MASDTDNVRYEFKYLLKEQDIPHLASYLKKLGLHEDESEAGRGYYDVTSLYFDTYFLRDYMEKRAGLKQRRKLRVRTYGDDFADDRHGMWLEVKDKYDMFIDKSRSPVTKDELDLLLENRAFLDSGAPTSSRDGKFDVRERFLYHYYRHGYRPNIVVAYRRKAYVGQFFSRIRLTIDSNITTCTWSDFVARRAMQCVAPGHAVLEVKFMHAMPWWFSDMTRRFTLVRVSFSKYTHAFDALTRVHPVSR